MSDTIDISLLVNEMLDSSDLPRNTDHRTEAIHNFGLLYDVIRVLRGKNGCPWDREQTPDSMKEDLVEEAYECVSAISDEDSGHLCEELGDLFLVGSMIGYMGEQEKSWSLGEAFAGVAEKLVRRHPHVFGTSSAETSEEVLKQWNQIKKEIEGRNNLDSVLSSVPKGVPPLDRAFRLQKKASRNGFDWDDATGVLEKISEEMDEVRAEVKSGDTEGLEAEIGDLLFSVINLARFLKIDPSTALHLTNRKFFYRFLHIEKRMKEAGLKLGRDEIEAMEQYWNEAKKKQP